MATYRVLRDLFDLLERAGPLREGTTAVFPNLTRTELSELAATARALAAGVEAEIEARPEPFPASLPPWLVMQWLPLCEVAAALRVAWSWRLDSEHYFRVFAERHRIGGGCGIIGVLIKWEQGVIGHVQMQRSGRLTKFQQQVLFYYRASGVSDEKFIPIGDAIAAVRLVVNDATAEQVKTAVSNLVSLRRLNASTTGKCHRAVFQVDGLDDLTPLQRRVLKYHMLYYATRDEGCNVHDVAAHFGTDLSLVRAAVDFLEFEDYLFSTKDDHYHYAYFNGQ